MLFLESFYFGGIVCFYIVLQLYFYLVQILFIFVYLLGFRGMGLRGDSCDFFLLEKFGDIWVQIVFWQGLGWVREFQEVFFVVRFRIQNFGFYLFLLVIEGDRVVGIILRMDIRLFIWICYLLGQQYFYVIRVIFYWLIGSFLFWCFRVFYRRGSLEGLEVWLLFCEGCQFDVQFYMKFFIRFIQLGCCQVVFLFGFVFGIFGVWYFVVQVRFDGLVAGWAVTELVSFVVNGVYLCSQFSFLVLFLM